MGRGNTVDIDVHCHAIGPYGFRVSLDGEDANAVWVNKGVVKSDHGDIERGKEATITIYEDTAIEKGLV